MNELLLRCFPILIFSVRGNSMLPTFATHKKLVAVSTLFSPLKKRDIVICFHPQTKQLVVKRIIKVKNGIYFVEGDNKKESIDSRTFGWLRRKNILAKVIYPKTVYYT